MTIYDVLRRLIALSPMGEQEKNDAIAAIDKLASWGGLGTLAGQLEVEAHDHIRSWPNGPHQPPVCGLCHKIMEA
jgi:hypothetical protein